MPKLSLRQAWLALIGGVLAVALVPAGLALDRQLARELEQKVRSDLAMAPKILADRNATGSDALMMHARDLSAAPGLADAVRSGRREEAVTLARRSVPGADEEAVLVGADGDTWTGPAPDSALVRATRGGEMPVGFLYRDGRLHRVSLAPLISGGAWTGAAGVGLPVGESTAGTLAGLTQSEVALFGGGGDLLFFTAGSEPPRVLLDSVSVWVGDGRVHEVETAGGRRYWAAVAGLGEAGAAAFVRSASEELALLPDLRRSALLAGLVALATALLLGGFLAARMGRPVRKLAEASQRLAGGDFRAPLPTSRIRELRQVGEAFGTMRSALRDKIRELTEANEELAERQDRLQALQSELIQRDRMAATGRLVTELAHEIRNPVASVRNCLEIIDNRLEPDSDLREFSGMAIDELLRMHRLSEQMLDANRPLDPDAETCRPVEVAETVAELARTAGAEEGLAIEVAGPADVDAAMGPDALKQVLLNLVENAREALEEAGGSDGGRIELRVHPPGRREEDGRVVIEVLDTGPGIDDELESRIFDPFFTTKDEVHGVGLGLFVAQGLVRRHGGSIRVSGRSDGGARFTIELPAADGSSPEETGADGT